MLLGTCLLDICSRPKQGHMESDVRTALISGGGGGGKYYRMTYLVLSHLLQVKTDHTLAEQALGLASASEHNAAFTAHSTAHLDPCMKRTPWGPPRDQFSGTPAPPCSSCVTAELTASKAQVSGKFKLVNTREALYECRACYSAVQVLAVNSSRKIPTVQTGRLRQRRGLA